ncbi:MAG TPA: SMP-30/gluconolactonase/LRE family protein [Ilumatobacter sp.]|jgi:sugar lactone lactonase YvrE|nr:SMP-30/gluconolactonase/LRE family protein [Ilumatobacter sp.]
MASGFEVVAAGLAFPESPRWHAGQLFLSEKRAGRVLTMGSDGSINTVAHVDGEPGGLGWTPDDDLLVVAMAKRTVVRVDADGEQHVAADLSAVTTCKCNDMVVDAVGNAYVGDFGYDLLGGAPPAPGVLALARPDGTSAVVATDLHFPNGCAITPGGELIVAESAANRLTAFRIEADGSLTGRRLFADLGGHVPDGICLDAEGAVWIADPLHNTVVRVADGGEVLERRATEQGAFACELGGDDGCTLFVCTYDAVASASPEPKPVGRLEVARVEVPRA